MLMASSLPSTGRVACRRVGCAAWATQKRAGAPLTPRLRRPHSSRLDAAAKENAEPEPARPGTPPPPPATPPSESTPTGLAALAAAVEDALLPRARGDARDCALMAAAVAGLVWASMGATRAYCALYTAAGFRPLGRVLVEFLAGGGGGGPF